MSDDPKSPDEMRREITMALTDQATINQLSSSGKEAQNKRRENKLMKEIREEKAALDRSHEHAGTDTPKSG